ncbi:MAG TPA: hypothetical protein QF753_13520 [Victivallales bacterium]|nr:hypothetical protein [Victivallales bacterium]
MRFIDYIFSDHLFIDKVMKNFCDCFNFDEIELKKNRKFRIVHKNIDFNNAQFVMKLNKEIKGKVNFQRKLRDKQPGETGDSYDIYYQIVDSNDNVVAKF